jgi:glyceraldehyde 3-phosphate dehydrogenase
MPKRIAINGFGRIGRNVLRAAALSGTGDLQFVAVNDLTDTNTLAHLLKYDSVHGKFPGMVEPGPDGIHVNGKTLKVLSEKDPAALPWKALQVDYVLEATGRFTDRDGAARHLTAGAQRVVISAPAKGEDLTVVFGVNHAAYDPDQHQVISNASCTTNGLVPVVKVIQDQFGMAHGFMSTIHAYTNDQQILDLPHKDLRRARAAAISIIPTTSGAAKATSLVLPELKGRIDGVAFRVPVADVSLMDLTCVVEKPATIADVNNAFRAAAAGPLQGVLDVTEEPLVSCDFIGNMMSSTVDLALTNVIGGTLLHVSSWYDNEMGYSARCLDLLRYLGTRDG